MYNVPLLKLIDWLFRRGRMWWISRISSGADKKMIKEVGLS